MTMYLITTPCTTPGAPAGVQAANAVTGSPEAALAALREGKGVTMFEARSLVARVIEYVEKEFQDPKSEASQELLSALTRMVAKAAVSNAPRG